MKIFPLIATAVLCTSLGLVIGRVSAPQTGGKEVEAKEGSTERSKQRLSQQRSFNTNYEARIERLYGLPPKGYNNRLLHLKSLINKMDLATGMMDFDVFGSIWLTAKDMTSSEISQTLIDIQKVPERGEKVMIANMILLEALAKKDGVAAMEYTMDHGSSFSMMGSKEMFFMSWSKKDPIAAYKWYEVNKFELSSGESRSLQATAIANYASKDFAKAFEMLKDVDRDEQKGALNSFGISIAGNPEQRKEFTRYLMSLGNESLQADVASKIVMRLAEIDHNEAIGYVEGWEGGEQSKLAIALVDQWAYTEPEKALNWQITQNAGELEPEGGEVLEIFANWAAKDAASAEKWLDRGAANLNKDDLRSKAALRTVWSNDYEEAVKWADPIEDPEKRTKSLGDIYRVWSSEDEGAADKWLESLGEEERTLIISGE